MDMELKLALSHNDSDYDKFRQTYLRYKIDGIGFSLGYTKTNGELYKVCLDFGVASKYKINIYVPFCYLNKKVYLREEMK